jgi:hypothetical protein
MRANWKTWAVVTAALVATVAGVAGAQDAPAPAAKKVAVGELAWLAGSWKDGDKRGSFEETWLPPAGGTMLAVSRQVAGEATKMVELSSIEADADGVLWLRVRHFGAGLTPWKSEIPDTGRWRLAANGAKEATFEDPEHDFPRTIAYKAGKDDTLEVTLEGMQGTKPMKMQFQFQRAK